MNWAPAWLYPQPPPPPPPFFFWVSFDCAHTQFTLLYIWKKPVCRRGCAAHAHKLGPGLICSRGRARSRGQRLRARAAAGRSVCAVSDCECRSRCCARFSAVGFSSKLISLYCELVILCFNNYWSFFILITVHERMCVVKGWVSTSVCASCVRFLCASTWTHTLTRKINARACSTWTSKNVTKTWTSIFAVFFAKRAKRENFFSPSLLIFHIQHYLPRFWLGYCGNLPNRV